MSKRPSDMTESQSQIMMSITMTSIFSSHSHQLTRKKIKKKQLFWKL